MTRASPIGLLEEPDQFVTLLFGILENNRNSCLRNFVDAIKMPSCLALIALNQAGFALSRETTSDTECRVWLLGCQNFALVDVVWERLAYAALRR
jgi:hypothetical protein